MFGLFVGELEAGLDEIVDSFALSKLDDNMRYGITTNSTGNLSGEIEYKMSIEASSKIFLEAINSLKCELEALKKSIHLHQKKYLTVPEAAIYMGLSVSYIYKLSSSFELPSCKPHGKLVYFLKDDLDHFMSRNRRKSQDEMERAA
ncbi:MAG: helix-turn-helix domain-containing protein [Bacteroidota bacterium]